MTPDQFLLALLHVPLTIYVKIIFLILALFYIVFASIIFRQIDVMNRVVETQFASMLRLAGLLHFALSIFVLLMILLFF
jgi:hypothetical protein